jgi:uncharacterized cupin superfamily protein
MNRILNIDSIEYETQARGKLFEARLGPIASRIGARLLGYRLTVLPPGKRAWPFHSHYSNEEMFFVLEGTGLLRLGDRNEAIRAGDFICAPPGGTETAHQIINDSEGELRYLCVSTMNEPDVAEYPDSGKFGVLAGSAPGGDKSKRTFSHVGVKTSQVDYWLGEEIDK